MIQILRHFLPVVIILVGVSCDTKSSDEKKTDSETKIVDEVVMISDQIIESPNNTDLYVKRAMIYSDRKLFDLAKRDIERALTIDSTSSKLHTSMGEVFFRANELRDSRLAFEKALEYDAGNTEAALKLAETNFLLRRYPEAISSINMALRVNDRLPKGYFLKGFIYKEIGDTTLSKSSFQTATEVNPEYYEAYMELGNLYAYEKNPIALEYFNTAIGIRPTSAEAHYHKGMYYQSVGETEKALKTYRELIKADPNGFLGYYNSGYLYLVSDTAFETALAYFDTVLTLQPGHVDAMYNKGLCYEEMGNYASAESIYRSVLEADPQYTLAAMGLERLLD